MNSSTKTVIALVVTTALTGGLATVPATPANAANFLERLFQVPSNKDYRKRREVERRQTQTRAKPVRVAKISGPRYYTYKPDQLRTVSLSDLTDPVTTGSVTDSSSFAGFPPLATNSFEEARPLLADIGLRALDEVGKALVDHYSSAPEFVWVTGSGVNERARSVLAVLNDAAKVGLDPQDYAVNVPEDAFDMSDMPSRQRDLMTFEMRLSRAVLTYALDATRGRVDPNRLSGYHDLPRKKVKLDGTLAELAASDDAGAALYARNPQGEHFVEFVADLERLRALDQNVQHVEIADGTFIRPGQSNPEMQNIVAAIRLKASDALKVEHALTFASYDNSDLYTPELVDLVKAFQKESNLSVDGVVGRNTIAAMTVITNADRIEKVLLAMERSRWLPGELPSLRVFINQPSFTASYYSPNRAEPLSMRVVVGKKSNQTYFFSDEIETVEFNPYWGVPQSIIVNEMLPKLRRDPSYLDRLGYEVTYKGRRVSSSGINWNGLGTTRAVGVRQPPSSKNALGELKILFPNSHAIYMHDTPSKHLFQRDMRAYSHGCIRLEDPRAMAAAVLGTTRQDVASEVANGQNHSVKVNRNIPVYVSYFTAWPKDDGSIGYYPDIYDRDAYLQKAIDATESERHAEG